MASRVLRKLLPSASVALLLWGAAACAPEPLDDADPLGTARERLAYDEAEINAQLPVPLPPGRDASRFDFCPMDRDLNLANARWLAWMSANAYGEDFGTWPGHSVRGIPQVRYPGALFSAFSALGFGNPGEDLLWVRDGAGIADALRRAPRRTPALATELFGRFDPSRDMGKLSESDPESDGDASFRLTIAGTQVYLIHHRRLRTVVVTFRGTRPSEGSSADVLSTLDFELVRWSDGRNERDAENGVQVHRGLRTTLHGSTPRTPSVAMRLLERLGSMPPGTQLWVTGHGRGGALANLFALHALEAQQSPRGTRFELAGLVTFGAPAVGNRAFGSELRRRLMSAGALHQRFVYGRDPVVHAVGLGRGLPDLGAFQHATRIEDARNGSFGRERGGGWEGAQYGSLEVQLPCLETRTRSGERPYASPVPASHARCTDAIFGDDTDHAADHYFEALVRAEGAVPASDTDRSCEETDGWRAACETLTRCLSSLGGAGCAAAPRAATETVTQRYEETVEQIRDCERTRDGGWACFQTYCGVAPAVPANVRECWSANGGWSCFRPR